MVVLKKHANEGMYFFVCLCALKMKNRVSKSTTNELIRVVQNRGSWEEVFYSILGAQDKNSVLVNNFRGH